MIVETKYLFNNKLKYKMRIEPEFISKCIIKFYLNTRNIIKRIN